MNTGGVGSQNLDTRLLRFRSKAGGENVVGLVEDLLAAGRAPDATEVVQRALQASPTDGDLLLLDGRARFASGDLLGAQASLLKAARATPKNKAPFRWLGEVLLKRGDPGRAAKVLERASAIDASDRAVQLLLERAQRLEGVASSSGDEEAARQAKASYARPPVADEEEEERTVIRSDLTEQLASLSREEELAKPPPAAESGPVQDWNDEGNAPESDAFYSDFEDEPTNLMAAKDLAPMMRARLAAPVKREPPPPKRQPPPAPPKPPQPAARRKPRIKKTLAFGSQAATEALAPAAAPAQTTTSPGAAHAPPTPPPKRRLPSEGASSFDASEDEIEGALGVLGGRERAPVGEPSPWDGYESVQKPLAPPAKPKRKSAPPAPPSPARPASVPPAPPKGAEAAAFPAAPEPQRPTPEPLGAQPSHDPFAAADAAPDPFRPAAEAAATAPAPPAPDLAVGGEQREDVDAILQMLKTKGLFEPPSGDAATWAKRAEVKKTQASGTRIGLWIGIVWVLAIGLAVGGWFGWEKYVEHRHAQAAALVETATGEAYGGDHRNLVDAERHLREARHLDPLDVDGPTLLLFVHAQRALEDGAFEAGYIRPTIDYADSLEGGDVAAYVDAARAVLAAAEGHPESARERIEAALEARPRDPAILYLAGRLEQRLGGEDALTHLEAAIQGSDSLNAARIALAEARFDEGRAEEALEILEQVLSNDDEHIRARLWRVFMTSDSEEPDAALATLAGMEEELEDQAAPTDHVVHQLARSRLLRRQGEGDAAGEAVDQALLAGATEPRLLALVAVEARRAGRLHRAEQAARTAVEGAPTNQDFRKLLAGIQLARRSGRDALGTLAQLPDEDPDVVEMRAHAALLMGSEEVLTTAAAGLDAYVEGNEESSVAIRALRIRLYVALGQAQQMLPFAAELSEGAPGDFDASVALGEAALRTFDSAAAVTALEEAVAASPDEAEGHYLLGRARRMAGDGEGAKESLERSVELTPEHTEARLALGGLLLDLGLYAEADALYTVLARSGRTASGFSVTVAGRLGRVESLIGLGQLDDAEVQLEQLQAAVRESPSARMTAARLALAQGQAGPALAQIRPLATAEGASANVLALYGDALLRVGRDGPAGEAYASALEADSGSPEALLGQAEIGIRAGNAGPASELLDRVRRILEVRIRAPRLHARVHILYGRGNLIASRAEAARLELEQAVAIEATPPDAHFFLGEALRAEDNTADARAAYERYLELAPEGPHARDARRRTR